MPIYEYVCQRCGKEFEEMQRFSDAPLEQCGCEQKAPVQRKVSRSAFHLKGGGWYKDGYGNAKSGSESSSDSSGTSSSKESKPTTEAKPATESKPAAESSSPAPSTPTPSSGGKESAA